MKELPYFKFDTSNWNAGNIMLESFEIQGLFINICSLYWHNHCDRTLAWAKQRYNSSIKNFEYLIDNNYVNINDNKIVIKFLDEQYLELKQIHKKNSQNGSKGAKTRWKKNYSPPIAPLKPPYSPAIEVLSPPYGKEDKDKDIILSQATDSDISNEVTFSDKSKKQRTPRKRNKHPSKKPPEHILKFTKKFITTIHKANKILGEPKTKIKPWSKALWSLEKTKKIEKSRIEKVLNWYCQELEKGLLPFTPEAYCGASFRDKFIKIENAMQRNTVNEPDEITYNDLTSKQKELYNSMHIEMESNKRINFDTLPELVILLEKWLTKTRKYIKSTMNENSYTENQTAELYLKSLFCERVFIKAYSMHIEAETKNWSKWHGDLVPGFEPGGKHFWKYLKEETRSQGYGGYDTIKEIVKNGL